MSWICKFLEHKPDRDSNHYRERTPNWAYPMHNIAARSDWNEENHFENYSTCVRCKTEISYVRWFNWWGDKDRVTDVGRVWLDTADADKITKAFRTEDIK